MEAWRALRPASVTGVQDLDEYGKAPRLPTGGRSPSLTRRWIIGHRLLQPSASASSPDAVYQGGSRRGGQPQEGSGAASQKACIQLSLPGVLHARHAVSSWFSLV